MGRPPRAKSKVLQSARKIVESRGAGGLTFDELAKVSGISRGGITYHFPTKGDLLRALLESDFAQWSQAEAALAPRDCAPELARVLGFIRAYTVPDKSRQRFHIGMLSAAMLDPSLMDPCRHEVQTRLGRKRWSDKDLRMHLLHLAVEGLMWQELFQLFALPPSARKRLVRLMEQLAREWSEAAEPAKA